MKVHIGPYNDWIGPYQIAEMLCFWVKKVPDEYGFLRYPDWVHNFGTWLGEDKHGNNNWLTNLCLWIESKRDRKVEVRIDYYDTYSMDHTLALIILPMLKQLKTNISGAPNVDDKDVPKELRSTSAPEKENEWDIDNNHFKRWDYVLDEMIWAFEQIVNLDNDSQFFTGHSNKLLMPVDKDGNKLGEPLPLGQKDKNIKADYYQLVDGPNDTSKFDKKGYDKHHKRIKNGTTLFGKYFRNLWV